jgi:O-methyltransferase
MRDTVRRRVLAAPRLSRIARLLHVDNGSTSSSLDFQAVDWYQDELRALTLFYRRAFQALTYNGIDGDYAEFGCCGARSFTQAWRASRVVSHAAHLWAFDSFEGLPHPSDPRDVHKGWTEGAMAMTEPAFVTTCLSEGMRRDAFTTVPGFYATSLAPDAGGPRPEIICFAYIDCDLYTSTLEALRFIAPRLCHGAVIACDDYFCCSTTHPSGERLALTEVFADHPRWRLLPYMQWGWYGMSFLVEDRANGPVIDIVGR